MSRILCFALAMASCVVMVACSGSMNSSPAKTNPSTPAPNAVPVSLSVRDTPPSGVAVLFFEASITGASLQPSDSSKPAVSVLTTPVEIEFSHLQTDTAFLGLGSAPPDTYQSMTLTFGNAVMTVVNHSGTALGGCPNNSVCQLSPTMSAMSATLSGTSFPITISANSVAGIELDLNVASSVQSDLSVNPMVTVTQVTQRSDSDEAQEMENVDEVDGLVTTVGPNQFTLMNERSGQSFTITVDSNTVYQDFDRSGCTATPADFTCVQMGQVLDVDLSGNGMGTMLAKRVEFAENANHQSIKGTITAVDSPTQFEMVVFNEEPSMSGISEGGLVTVAIQPNAVFQVGGEEMDEDGGFSMGGLSFSSGTDLMVGQDVQIRPGTVSSSSGQTTVTTALVRLWPSQITGTVASVDQHSGTITLNQLSPLFTGATPPINAIKVVTLSSLHMESQSGTGSVLVGNTLSVKGLLFNTAPTPTLVTRTMREHGGD